MTTVMESTVTSTTENTEIFYQRDSPSASSIETILPILNDIFEEALKIAGIYEEPELLPVERISPELVGDILENILRKKYPEDETLLLDEQIKEMIKSMRCPDEAKTPISTVGVGDQLELPVMNEAAAQSLDQFENEELNKRNVLERKSRLTNLVHNSKQVLTKLMNNSNENLNQPQESTEFEEQLIKVINLDREFVNLVEVDFKANTTGPCYLETVQDNLKYDEKSPKFGEECPKKEKSNIGIRIWRCLKKKTTIKKKSLERDQ